MLGTPSQGCCNTKRGKKWRCPLLCPENKFQCLSGYLDIALLLYYASHGITDTNAYRRAHPTCTKPLLLLIFVLPCKYSSSIWKSGKVIRIKFHPPHNSISLSLLVYKTRSWIRAPLALGFHYSLGCQRTHRSLPSMNSHATCLQEPLPLHTSLALASYSPRPLRRTLANSC